jgi:predicted nucleic acid-binding protein
LLKYKTKFGRNAAEKLLLAVTVYPFDRASARKAAALCQKLAKTGKMINENDLLIAGTSMSNEDILLTRDQKFSNLDEATIKIV